MAIVLIVEDGSGLPNSNTYADVAAARQYAEERGVELPSDDNKVAQFLIQAMDYLEAQGCKYQGRRTSSTQALQWPRTGVILGCDLLPPNVIPKALISAQFHLMAAASEGIVLQPNMTPADYVIQETVGPITTKYADPTINGVKPVFTAVDSLLNPLLGICSGNARPLTLTRI